MVDFLSLKTTELRPQVLAQPFVRARARPKHDHTLTPHSPPCAPAGQAAGLLWCFFRHALVAQASTQLQTLICQQSATAQAASGGGRADAA